MKFDPYTFAADQGIGAAYDAIRADRAIPAAPNSTNSTNSTHQGRSSGPPEAELNSVNGMMCAASTAKGGAAPDETIVELVPGQPAMAALDDQSPPTALCSVTGKPMTWTGKVVSLETWRRLSAWERHGPDGRVYCGACRAWVKRDADCASSDCWKGGSIA